MLLRLLFEWLFKPMNTADQAAKPAAEATKSYFGLAPAVAAPSPDGSPSQKDADDKTPTAKQPFSILITKFAGDTDGTAAGRVFQAVDSRRDTDARLWDKRPDGGAGGDGLSGLNAIVGQCWRWIDETGADVAVWGKVEEHGLRIRFVPNDSAIEGDAAALPLTASLLVPREFDDSVATLIHTAAVAAILPQSKKQDEARSAMLLSKTQALQEHLGRADHTVDTQLTVCSILLFIAMRKGDKDLLRAVGDHLRVVHGGLNRDDAAVSWGLAARLLGDALWLLSQDVKDIDGMERAAEAYRAAGDDKAMHALPSEWAEAQARLGKVYYKLALNKPDMRLLKNSVAAYNGALTVFKKAVFPHRWADIQSGVAQALMAYGEATGNGEIMSQAAEVLKAVLLVRNRNTHPLPWAATQNNLGAAAFAQAKQTNDMAALRQAQEAFSLALEVYKAANATRLMHVTNSNLMRVERLLETWGARAGAAQKKSSGGGPAAAE